MEAIEFTTKIIDGVIKIPVKNIHYPTDNVKVILLFKPVNLQNQKEKLENIFQEMQKLSLFSSIENPINWQRNLRNDWK